jgi:hypothetical protein
MPKMALQKLCHIVSNDDSLDKDIPMELTKYQKLYLQTAYDFFLENATWPTYRQVEVKILPTHEDFNVTEVARSLADPAHRNFITNDLTSLAILSLEQIRQCYGSEKDLANFVFTIRYCAEKYRFSPDAQVEVSSNEIREKLQLEELSIQKIGMLFSFSPVFSSISVDADGKRWTIRLRYDVINFRGIRTIDDYFVALEKRNKSFFEHAENPLLNAVPIINPAPIIEMVAQTDPANIQQTTANLMQIDNSYYINALNQSQRSFNWALIGGGVGVVFFIAAVFILIFRQPISESYVAAIITTSSGGVVEIIAGIILVLHSRASNQANQCHERLNRMQRFLVAIGHCENLEGDLKNTTRAGLINKLGDLQ